MKLRSWSLAIACAIAVLWGAPSSAQAALMVYEGFNGYTPDVDMAGQAVNANTVGLNQATNWDSNATTEWHTTTGLTFGSGNTTLETHGDAVRRQTQTSSVLHAQFNIDPAYLTGDEYVGTLYTSHLVHFDYDGGTASPDANVHVVVTDGSSGSRRLRSGARVGNGGSDIPVGIKNVGNSFTNGTGNVNVDGQTFMILSRFTRVGESVSGGDPAVATLWALSSDQFDYFKTNDWADIDSATVGTGATNVWAKAVDTESTTTAVLDNSLLWQLGSGSDTAAIVMFDELRMGTTFNAVTPVVPEPASIALALLGLAGIGYVRLRKK